MGRVVFSGHAGLETSTDPATVTVPNDTEIHFHTDNLKALLDNIGGDIETMSAAFDIAMPSQSVYAGQSVRNYTLYDPEDLNMHQSPADVDQIVLSGGSMTLGQLFDAGVRGQCFWAACRVVDLAAAGGELLGGDVGSSNRRQRDRRGQPVAPVVLVGRRGIAGVAAFHDLPSGYKRIYCDYSPDLATWARQRSYIV